jgi:hypothetical protein
VNQLKLKDTHSHTIKNESITLFYLITQITGDFDDTFSGDSRKYGSVDSGCWDSFSLRNCNPS